MGRNYRTLTFCPHDRPKSLGAACLSTLPLLSLPSVKRRKGKYRKEECPLGDVGDDTKNIQSIKPMKLSLNFHIWLTQFGKIQG